jgi:hypothetical protein
VLHLFAGITVLLPQAVTDETLKKLDAGYLRDMKLQGVERINKVFLRQQKSLFPDPAGENGYRQEEEWVLDTEGVNLMGVSGRTACRKFAGTLQEGLCMGGMCLSVCQGLVCMEVGAW